ncbi:MAG: hypothetical protein ACREQL_08660 [Candidatus Binatia bacterium]
MRRTAAVAALGLLLVGGDAWAARHVTRCCVTITEADGTQRPYCFNLITRTQRLGRLLCRLTGGRPQRIRTR